MQAHIAPVRRPQHLDARPNISKLRLVTVASTRSYLYFNSSNDDERDRHAASVAECGMKSLDNSKCIPGRQLWGRWSPFMKNYHSQKHSETLIDHAHRQIYIKF